MAEEQGSAPIEEGKCDCKPGLPGWMATFSDLVTLLLTFFVLLLSFAKTESSKYEAALGSIRNAFGGNVLKKGKVITPGKSPDNAPTMLDAVEPIKPFPIEYLTTEGFLDKHEVNRESDEDLKMMRGDLNEFGLRDSVDIYEMPEGIKVRLKDKILFNVGETSISTISIEVFDKLTKLLANKNWTVFVEGHASFGEKASNGDDAFVLSSKRAAEVTRSLVRRGVDPANITTVFYGDTRIINIPGKTSEEVEPLSRRVEFIIRKRDLSANGNKVR